MFPRGSVIPRPRPACRCSSAEPFRECIREGFRKVVGQMEVAGTQVVRIAIGRADDHGAARRPEPPPTEEPKFSSSLG